MGDLADRAWAALRQGDHVEGMALARQAVARAADVKPPDFAGAAEEVLSAYDALAVATKRNGDWAGCIADLKAAADLLGDTPSGRKARHRWVVEGAWFQLRDADLALQRNDNDRAIARARQLLERFPRAKSPDFEGIPGPIYRAHHIIASALRGKGDPEAHRAQLETMVGLFHGTPYKPRILCWLAQYHEQQRAPAQGLVLLQQAPGLSEGTPLCCAYSQMADCYERWPVPRWEAIALTLERAIALAESPEGRKESWFAAERRAAAWDRRLEDATGNAFHGRPGERTLGYVDLVQAGEIRRAYAYLAEATRADLTLDAFTKEASQWLLPGTDPGVFEGPTEEAASLSPGEKQVVTSIRLRLKRDKPGAPLHPLWFEWIQEADKVWRLAKAPVEVPRRAE